MGKPVKQTLPFVGVEQLIGINVLPLTKTGLGGGRWEDSAYPQALSDRILDRTLEGLMYVFNDR